MSEAQQLKGIWDAALVSLQETNGFSNAIMTLWFNELEIVLLTDSSVVLNIKSNFKCQIIKSKYLDHISRALEDVLKYPVTVDVRSTEDQEHEIEKARGFTFKRASSSLSDEKKSPSDASYAKEESYGIGALSDSKREGSFSFSGNLSSDNGIIESSEKEKTQGDSSLSSIYLSGDKSSSDYDKLSHSEKAKTLEKLISNDNDDSYFSVVGKSKVLNYANLHSYKEYTFDTFVVGKSNEFARAAAMSVANNPSKEYNPLFIYGPSGLGKTHLLCAIIDRISKNFPDYKIVSVKGEDFTNQMIDSISRGITSEFRDKYRKSDVLLIDDIQFIAGKDSTQEEFFHTFNSLYEDHKQIILTSDRPPKDIKLLENRLKTRFESGLIADIQPPDIELRTAILKKKSESLGLSIPPDVLSYIADNLKNNVRQLEGAVKRIGAQNMLTGSDITVDLAIKCISDMLTGSEPVSVTVDKVIDAVASHYCVSADDIKSKKRTSNIASARHVAIYLIRNMTTMSLPAIGRVFSRDHSTIMNSLDTVESKIKSNPETEKEIKELIRVIKE